METTRAGELQLELMRLRKENEIFRGALETIAETECLENSHNAWGICLALANRALSKARGNEGGE